MDRSDVVKLISETFTKGADGIFTKTEMEKQVYAHISSVSQTEWFEGGRIGLNPSLKVTMFKYDYGNENIVKWNGMRYTIYRTYEKQNDEIELYLELDKGNE